MLINKINLYLLVLICRYFFLILFIFLSVSWLLQVTRLFTVTNFLNVEILDILLLSIHLIPYLVTVIIPFILIFGLLLSFIKLNKDNELIAILSLGFGLNPFKKTLIFFCLIISIFFTILNFYFAPKIYEQYKYEESQLRNTVNFNNMNFSNFFNLNANTIIDFKKNNNEYQEIFIKFTDEKENIIYAKKGNIFNENNKYNFQLSNGFKISIDTNNQIEKLEFLNYVLKIENNNISNDKIIDKNTLTIFDDYKSNNFLNISFRVIDILLIIFLIYFFYSNNLKVLNFNTINNIYFASLSAMVIIINQILKNSEIVLINYIIIISILVFSVLFISFLKKKYEQN